MEFKRKAKCHFKRTFWRGSEDGTAKLWNIKGKLIKTFEEKFETQYTAATFSRDGQFAIVSSKDNNIDFWYLPK